VEYVFFLDCFKLKVGQAKNGHIISLAATFNLLCLPQFPPDVIYIISFIPVALPTSAFSVLLAMMEGEYLLFMVCLHTLSLFAQWVDWYIQQILMPFIHRSVYNK